MGRRWEKEEEGYEMPGRAANHDLPKVSFGLSFKEGTIAFLVYWSVWGSGPSIL